MAKTATVPRKSHRSKSSSAKQTKNVKPVVAQPRKSANGKATATKKRSAPVMPGQKRHAHFQKTAAMLQLNQPSMQRLLGRAGGKLLSSTVYKPLEADFHSLLARFIQAIVYLVQSQKRTTVRPRDVSQAAAQLFRITIAGFGDGSKSKAKKKSALNDGKQETKTTTSATMSESDNDTAEEM